MRELQKEPRDFGCGPYGKDQQTTYFEYHPKQNPAKFIYVVYGMDAPLFDENNIVILARP